MSEEKGYDVLDAKEVCKEHEMEKKERLMRIQGMDMMMEDDMKSGEIKGFIKRNNVMDRL